MDRKGLDLDDGSSLDKQENPQESRRQPIMRLRQQKRKRRLQQNQLLRRGKTSMQKSQTAAVTGTLTNQLSPSASVQNYSVGQPSAGPPPAAVQAAIIAQEAAQRQEGIGVGKPAIRAMISSKPKPVGQVQHSQEIQQLLQTLKSPNSPQQQQEVISILKTYPQQIAAFIKQRSQEGLQQQQLQQLQQQQLQQQRHQNPALQMPNMQQQPQQQFQYFTRQQKMLWRQRLQQEKH